MFAIDEAKLPPPRPAVAADTANTQYGVAGIGHAGHHQSDRHEQQRGGDRRPVPPAEAGHGRRVGDAHRGTDQVGQGDEPEELVHGERETGGGQTHRDRAPQQPDREAHVLDDDRPDEVAAGDPPPGHGPEAFVIGMPVGDPATPRCWPGCGNLRDSGRHGGQSVARALRRHDHGRAAHVKSPSPPPHAEGEIRGRARCRSAAGWRHGAGRRTRGFRSRRPASTWSRAPAGAQDSTS